MNIKLRFVTSLLMACLGKSALAQVPLVFNVENRTPASTCVTTAGNTSTSTTSFPNPFAFTNGGTVASCDDWICRRNQIKSDIENYEIGPKPSKPASVTATYSGGKLNITSTVNGQSLTQSVTVTVPSGTGPFPVVIGMNAGTGSLTSSLFSGCIQINFAHDQVVTYANGSGSINSADPYFKLYPSTNIGKYSAWSWGISRIIDGLELTKSTLNADLTKICVTGCSYAGKMALFGGAFDERVALTIAQESGGGGINSWRTSKAYTSRTGVNVEKIDNTNYSWFKSSMKNLTPETLPHDHHELIAMIAPRALLVLGNPTQEWLCDESGYKSCMAANEVWKSMGVSDRFGWVFTPDHNHCSASSDQNTAVTTFVNRFLKGQNVTTNVRTNPTKGTQQDLSMGTLINWTTPTLTGCSGTSTCTTAAPTVTAAVSYTVGAAATSLSATPVSGGALNWYGTNATGGTASTTAPTPNTTTAGTTTYYVSQTANSCEGPRAAITVSVTATNCTTTAPTVTATVNYTQGATVTALTATGTALKWYTVASGGTGSATAPTPSTTTAGTVTYYVSQTLNNCEGPRASITVTVTASTGGSGTPISTTFTGTPASCVITAPHNNAYFQVGKAVTIRVYSTDFGGSSANGTVQRVEFFDNDVFLASVTTQTNNTFEYVVNCLTSGTHRFTARAVDNSGNVSGSAGVKIVTGTAAAPAKGLSTNKGKYLANIIAGSVPANYGGYWNGVTAENGCKWGSVEGTRDQFNWGQADISYNYANTNNLMFRYHALAWGSQYPNWITSLSVADFKAEMIEYMDAVAARYPNIDQIDVLNEQLGTHAGGTGYFRDGLGGNNGGTAPDANTGFDWQIWLFRQARNKFPNAKLVLNDYGLENDINAINQMLNLVKVLRDRNLIDGFGTQAHEFNINTLTASQMTNALNTMDNGGVPIYVTELDISGTDSEQNTRYNTLLPVYWNHPAVGGITLWGYIDGQTWKDNTGLVSSAATNATESPAMGTIKTFISGRPNVGYPYATQESTGCVITATEDVDVINGISVYPNPFNSNLNIVVKGQFSYELVNQMGQSLEKNSATDEASLFNEFPKGVYFLKITQEEKSSIIKLIKE